MFCVRNGKGVPEKLDYFRHLIRHVDVTKFGYEAVEGKVHIHDWHATILHLLGLDHEKLTYRYAGRDMRLTDVKGNVVTSIIR